MKRTLLTAVLTGLMAAGAYACPAGDVSASTEQTMTVASIDAAKDDLSRAQTIEPKNTAPDEKAPAETAAPIGK